MQDGLSGSRRLFLYRKETEAVEPELRWLDDCILHFGFTRDVYLRPVWRAVAFEYVDFSEEGFHAIMLAV